MGKNTAFNFLIGFLLAGRLVVADDAGLITTGNQTNANPRCVSAIPLEASATGAVSATISNFNLTTAGPATNALPPLPSGVSELKFSEFFRQPIGPRGLEYTTKLRSLDGRRIQIPGCESLQSTLGSGGICRN